MRKLSTLLFCLLMVTFAIGKPVSIEKSRQVADNYFSQFTGKSSLSILNSFSKEYNGITTYHVFNYVGGGFVVVSADDVATPILAQSNEGYVELIFTNSNTEYWFDLYNKEIAHLVATKADNAQSTAEWNQISNNNMDVSLMDVGPLLSTTWDQGQWYNYYCPTAAGGPGGKCWAGCVATTMGQIMKYYNFPAKGYLSHSYVHPTYGQQTANFGATTYNFASMGNSANSGSYQQIATLLYQAGVSVDMNYAPDGSGAFSEDVPYAMSTYFNYNPANIAVAYKSTYSASGWKDFLKSELDANRPLFYAGSSSAGGHAWVCDGYRSSDSKFHMNWGWSGASNGYFAIGALNTGNGSFNSANAVVHHIFPGNPNLVVRFTNLNKTNTIAYGSQLDINCSVFEGTPTNVKLYIDNNVVFTSTQTTFSYPWNTALASLGTHDLKVEAINSTDTVYHKVTVSLSEWIPQASGFTTPSRGIKYIHALDSNVVWGTAYDGTGGAAVIQEFTKTINGGATWTPGVINGCSGLEPSMIFAISKDTAYAPMYKQTGSNPQGIYMTKNGGTTWTRQTSASFSNATSFPNVVHFFNKNDGFCMGDPINGEFELYTTSNGGNTWTAVPAGNMANPLSGEFGVVGYYSSVGNSIWFGTNLGRVYRSINKGLNWEASTTTLGAKYTDVEFRDALNGIAADKSEGSTGTLSQTSDGGVTWTELSYTGTAGTADFCYVPGTENTWVSTESNTANTLGAFFSFDGGASWAPFLGTETEQFLAVDFVNNHCGWAGHFNQSSTNLGFHKFVGLLVPLAVLNPVSNLTAVPNESSVNLTWLEPLTPALSYNIYRDDVLLSNTTSPLYLDTPVSNGMHTYCVTAVYDNGESAKTCVNTWITTGLVEEPEAMYRIYPNPATEIINLVSPVVFTEVRIINDLGKVVYTNTNKGMNLKILTAGFKSGMYIMQIVSDKGIVSKKVTIK